MRYPWPLTTDQQACFDAPGEAMPCASSGRAAGQPPAKRFEVRGAMVLDTLTGLRWSRDANPFEFPYSWEEAFDLIAGLNRSRTHGREDWRLPSRRELFSLISHRLINPALPQGHPFRNVFHGYYWTATPCARLSDQAWYIHLGGGRVYRGRQQGACLVWPVAGSGWHPLPPAQRFRVQGLAVEDRLTELWWTPSARTGCAQMTWEDALRAPSALNRDKYGGRTDWRLPNIRELESLVDLARHSPALPASHPFRDAQEGYWSATTSAYERRYAWVLYMQDGAVGVGFKPEATFSAWTVASAGQTASPAGGKPS